MKAAQFMANFSAVGGHSGNCGISKMMTREEVLEKRHFVRIAFNGLPTYLVPVEFADDASRIFCEVRDENGYGASDMKTGCGDIVDVSGAVIGRISYNGRIWENV